MNATQTRTTRPPRGYTTLFSTFGEQAWCPHCGNHYEREKLADQAPAAEGVRTVVCPICHAHGLLPGGKAQGGDA